MKPSLAKLTVLVADTSANGAGLIIAMLRGLKISAIREVHDAESALAELRRQSVDLLLIDETLDGVALSRTLRSDEQNPSRYAAIIMMSARPDARHIGAARDAGVTEFLRKPFSANQLAGRLAVLQTAPRSFVEGTSFKGPDRRRRAASAAAPQRRTADKSAPD